MAIALSKRGFPVESIVFKGPDRPSPLRDALPAETMFLGPGELSGISSEVVLITTRDDQINGTAEQIAQEADCSGVIFLHTSGSRTSAALDALKAKGAVTGSLHPLVSISDPFIGSDRFEGAYFCVEGDPEAVAAAGSIAEGLGGRPFEIPTDSKPLYHAAAVMACGHLVALISEALEVLTACGPDRETSKDILLPLIQSTVGNLEEQDLPEALTGTFARADSETFRAHLEAFDGSVSDEIITSYLLLARRSLELAAARKAPPKGIAALADEVDGELSGRLA